MRTRLLTLFVSLVAVSSIASGYYNWVYFAGRNGPFTPIPAKINLTSLTNNKISFFVSNQPPASMVPGDTFQALVSQIQAAANVWNQVQTSSLRLAFGGLEAVGAVPQSTPGIDVIFDDDMPPGLLAQTRLSMPSDVSFIINGASLVPITRSTVQLRSDLTVYQQASYYDSVFLTIVHEFGHALGLQHTLTSGVMATAVTRATTKAAPLSADDIAGISTLYPADGYLNNTGVIAGAVLQNGSGVNLASVVALCAKLCANGIAISGLTNPDGTYAIGGVPPGQYYVYTHPLPPPGQGEAYPDNIISPVDSQQNPFPANTGMDTQFFSSTGGTRDWTQAGLVTVAAGATTTGVNFPNMQVRSGPAIYAMQTYGYPGQIPLPAPWLMGGSRLYLVFSASGATANGKLTPGLNVSVIGGSAFTEAGTLSYYGASNGFVGAKVVLDTNAVSTPTPAALALSVPNDLYVLPAALTVVPNPAPVIASVSATGAADPVGNPIVTVSGADLSASTQVVFDGAPAAIQSANSDGSLTVVAPAATANYVASVEALSSDGQTSLQALGATPAPVQFTYFGPANPSLSVNQGQLLPGSDSEVSITGINTNFVDGQVSVGFGTSDVLVRHVWVKSPQELLLNVTVLPSAQGPVQLTVASGLQMETPNSVLQLLSNPSQMSLNVPILNALTNLEGVPAGGGALINTTGLPQNLTGWTLTVNGQPTTFYMGGGNQIGALIPAGLPVGPAVVQLISPNGSQIPPVVMQIIAPPPVVLGVVNSNGVAISSSNPARRGDTLTVTVMGLADPASATAPAASSVNIIVRGMGGVGVNQAASAILPGTQAGTSQIQFMLSSAAPYGPQEQLTVGLGLRISPSVNIPISTQ